MELFVHLPDYRIIICIECKIACVASQATAHLYKYHESISSKTKRDIIAKVAQIPDLIQDQRGLCDFPFPTASVAPIPVLQEAKTDGLQCITCRYIARQPQQIQAHCRKEHGWVNEWKKGGHIAAKKKVNRTLPYRSGVSCQRFFASRRASGWFEVQGPGRFNDALCKDEDGESCLDWILRLQSQHEEKAASTPRIEVATAKSEINSWVHRTGWARHLQGLEPLRVHKIISPIQEAEVVLSIQWASAERVLDQARALCTPERVGLAVLFELSRVQAHTKPSRPFQNQIEEATWTRYKSVFCKLLCFWFRSQEEDYLDLRPLYRFSTKQARLFHRFREATQDDSEGPIDEATTDRRFLDLIVSLFRCPLLDNEYDNAILSGLALLGLREDGGWESPGDYTWIYSATIKVARVLTLYQAYREREEDVSQLACRMSRREAYEQTEHLLQRVRTKSLSFLVRVPGGHSAEAQAASDSAYFHGDPFSSSSTATSSQLSRKRINSRISVNQVRGHGYRETPGWIETFSGSQDLRSAVSK